MGSPEPASERAVVVERIRDWAELSETKLQGEWETLVARARYRSVFQTYAWNRAWWEVFGAAYEPYILLLRRNGELIGLAPFVRSKSGALEWLGGTNFASDYCDLILRDDVSAAEGALLREFLLTGQGRDWRRLDAVNIPENGAALELRAPLLSRDFQIDAPARVLGDRKADQAVLAKKSLKRHFAYFAKAGKLEFAHFESAEEIERQLPPFFAQHIARRAVTDTPSLFIDPKEQEFYRRAAHALLAEGQLRFSGVFLDGRPIAYHFGFEFERKYIWYKPSFEVTLLKKSPGEVLLKYLLEYAIARGLAEFDFTVGDEEFKYRFANVVRTCYRLKIFPGTASYLMFRGKRLIKRILGRLPKTRPLTPPGTAETL